MNREISRVNPSVWVKRKKKKKRKNPNRIKKKRTGTISEQNKIKNFLECGEGKSFEFSKLSEWVFSAYVEICRVSPLY